MRHANHEPPELQHACHCPILVPRVWPHVKLFMSISRSPPSWLVRPTWGILRKTGSFCTAQAYNHAISLAKVLLKEPFRAVQSRATWAAGRLTGVPRGGVSPCDRMQVCHPPNRDQVTTKLCNSLIAPPYERYASCVLP